jgi:hypothetical protein
MVKSSNDEGHKDVDYSEATTQEWFAAVEGWSWEKRDDDRIKAGKCPRCNGDMDRVLTGGSLMYVMPSQGRPVMIRCNCKFGHKGRPEGISDGCGQVGRFTPPEDRK